MGAFRSFNWSGFARFSRNALLRCRGTHYRLTPRRVTRAVAFYTMYPLLESLTWAGLTLDELFFRGYRSEKVREPVFIIGNPRSGTTFLHRLLARDVANFYTMRTWEILLAPSIVQRRVWRALSWLDDRLGAPLKAAIRSLERRVHDDLVTHRLTLADPEEDEFLLLHIWSSLTISVFSAVMEDAAAYARFDRALPRTERQRIMSFYVQCVQRHIHAHGLSDGRHYLAKNPNFSPKIDSIRRAFTDAKFIYLVRNPLDVIPSYTSLLDLQWRILADPLDKWAARDLVLDMARSWYSYPLERLAEAPPERYAIVRYDELVVDTEETVLRMYERLGLQVDPCFARILREEAERERSYVSRHHYSLEDMGLTTDQIVCAFRDVFERFNFDTRGASL